MLEAARIGIVEVEGETVCLTANWSERRRKLNSHAFHRRHHETLKSEPTAAGLEAVRRSHERWRAGLAAIAGCVDAAAEAEEVRRAGAFVRDRLRELGRIRLALLQDIWHDAGGDPWTIPQAVEAMGCRVEELPEFGRRRFVFPPAEGAA